MNFWEYCQLRASEFYTDDRADLRLVANTLQALYERKTTQRKVLIMLPHRSGKTRTLQLFAEWVLKKRTTDRIIAATYNAHNALDFSHYVETEGCEKSAFKSVGVGDSLTSWSADISILDDPIKDAYEANSTRTLDKQWKWFENAMSARLDPNGIQIVCMMRWCDGDIAGRILRGVSADEWLVRDLINGGVISLESVRAFLP